MSRLRISRQNNQSTHTLCDKIFYPLIFVSLFLLISLFAHSAYGAQVTLAWDPSSGTPAPNYKLYWRTSEAQQYQLLSDVGDSTQETVSNLVGGTTYYFAATAYIDQNTESGYSNQISYTAQVDCTYSISPGSQTFVQAGGTGTVNVVSPNTCTWSASSGAPSWMTITSGSSGTGNGTVSYSVSVNTGTASRTAASTIAGQLFTVNQAGVQTYSLATSTSGTGSGSVTANPSGSTFTAGTVVTLTAAAGANSTFSGWSGACSGTSATCQVTMNSNTTVGASFNATTYSLTVTKSGTGSGTATTKPSGTSFKPGATVTLTAKPAANSGFLRWSGACSGAATTCKIAMDGDVSVNAEFASYNLTVSTSGVGTGTVRKPSRTSFKPGAVVRLTARPSASSSFVGWSGACSGASKTCNVKMDSDANVEAIFVLKTYTITASAGDGGAIIPSGVSSATIGSTQSYAITPTEGYMVDYLRVDGSKKASSTVYGFSNIKAKHNIVAYFKKQ